MYTQAKFKKYTDKINKGMNGVCLESFKALLFILEKALKNGNNIFVMGNGGSGSTASHFKSDMDKGASSTTSKFRFICLNDNIPLMLSYANDINYNSIFVEQLINFIKPSDVIIGFSGSGNSKNVIKVIKEKKL